MGAFFDKTYREILEEAASSSPTPGGGNVSAMVACLGNAMISMVANLTKGKEKYVEYQDQVEGVLAKSNDIMTRLEDLVDADMQVFGKFMKAIKMPKETDEEKQARSLAMEEASKIASDVPLGIAETCVEIIELSVNLVAYGNKGAISDVGVGAYIAEASMEGALLSVDINLGGIKDQEYVNQATVKMENLRSKARELREKTIAVVKVRM